MPVYLPICPEKKQFSAHPRNSLRPVASGGKMVRCSKDTQRMRENVSETADVAGSSRTRRVHVHVGLHVHVSGGGLVVVVVVVVSSR